MASTYGVITVANLESRSGEDYETSYDYDDTLVEVKISDAEEFIKSTYNVTPTSSNSAHVSAVGRIAEIEMANKIYREWGVPEKYTIVKESEYHNYVDHLFGVTMEFGFASHEDDKLIETGDGN